MSNMYESKTKWKSIGNETEIIQKSIVMIDFFVFRKNHRKVASMIKFIKKELEIEKSLKQRIMIICDFCNTTPTIRNDSIRKIGIEEEPSKFRYTIFAGVFTEKLGIDLLIMCEIMFGKILKKFISYLS